MLSHTHTHTLIHRGKPTDFRMVVAESVLYSVCPWRNSTSDEKELEFSLVRHTWRLDCDINPLFLICLTLLLFFRLKGQRKAVITAVDKKVPNGILEEQGTRFLYQLWVWIDQLFKIGYKRNWV